MRAVVFAYHALGCLGLRKLIEHGFDIAQVVTHPDDASEEIWWPSVRELAETHAIPCNEVRRGDDEAVEELVAHLHPDFLFSFYFRHLLTRRCLSLARVAALNLHGSLLPSYRGCAPVNWVLINGEPRTGVSLHIMVPKADAGPVVDIEPVDIAETDTAYLLYQRLIGAAGVLLDRSLPRLGDGTWCAREQDVSAGSYFPRRNPEDGRIVWEATAKEIHNLVRALTHPYPGAFTTHKGRRMTLWWTRPRSKQGNAVPGTVIAIDADSVLVAAQESSIEIILAQREGEPAQPAGAASEFWGLKAGDVLGK